MSRAAQTEAEKIRRFGRYARALSLAVIAAAALFALWLAVTILLGPGPAGVRVSLGQFFSTADKITTAGIKVYALLVVALAAGLSLAALLTLRALFADLAAGAIYTAKNVARLRRLGVLTLAMAAAGIVVPVASAALVAAGWIDAASVTRSDHAVGPDPFSLFITGGIILLASWIMEVGRQASDEAEALRREAELVV
ncbi:MAG TPA: DUF2975 domain-containing protein [Gammaproteobacteria bacterium]